MKILTLSVHFNKSAKLWYVIDSMIDNRFFALVMSINRRMSPISARDISCPACSQVGTYENLVDHFCRSQLVVKAKVNAVSPTHISLRNARSLKKGDRRRSVEDMDVRLNSDSSACPCNITDTSERRFLVMASK
ncbi:unnamed protein product, partial [Strongylus vulgaris]